jgi:signal transduction histidine kinase/DNA-binding response OmpR family regulator
MPSMTDNLTPELAAACTLGGAMGRRFARFDWGGHPLGAPAGWPVSWRSAVAAALTSKFPIVLWLGSELVLVYNDGYVPMLGEKHPAALGERGHRVWWDIWETVGPMLAGVLATGEATWSNDLMLGLVADGRPWERYFTFSYSPILDDDGKPDGVFCAVAETTERVLGERRLRVLTESAGRLFKSRTVREAIATTVDMGDGSHPDLPFLAVYAARDDGPPTLAGAGAPMRGLLPADLGEWVSRSSLPPSIESPLVLDLSSLPPGPVAADDGAPIPERALLTRLTGPGVQRFLVLGLTPHRPLDEQYRGFCRLVTDQVAAALSSADSFELERRRADELAQLDRAKTVFLTNVSHEFRTPLTLLLGPLDDAVEAEADPGRGERLRMARRNASRLLRLVNALLEFARTEAGRAQPAPVRVDLGALTAQVASSFAGLCERAGLDLVLDCPPTAAEVDPAMWETIVLNLLSNAVKFTLAGTIAVRVSSRADAKVSVAVTDTGAGIAERDLPHLFERFYRADSSAARTAEGSGIGLSLVRSLVDLHGGDVTIDSALGQGTTVSIVLPAPSPATPAAAPPDARVLMNGNPYLDEAMDWIQAEQDPDPAVPDSAASGADGGERPLILIADDNADMRRHLQRICAEHWRVEVAADGAAALAAMRTRLPDALVTDVMMPGLDGLGLVAAIRADPQLSSVPVVMLSARAGVEAAGAGLSAGADDYLPKPFRSQDLVNRLTARLNAGARQRETYRRAQAQARQATASAEFAEALSAANSVEAVLSALLGSPSALGAEVAVLGMLDAERGTLRTTYAGDLPAAVREGRHTMPADAPLPLPHVVRSARPAVIADLAAVGADFSRVAPEIAAATRAAAIHPLHDRSGAVVGALALCWPQPRTLTAEELGIAAHGALVAGQALERIRLAEREHRIAVGFQDHHLDLDRRSHAAVLGAVYQPAAELMRVGGDWYLSAALPQPDRVAVLVGDAVGHGLPAATVMSRMRAAATTATLIDPAPPFVLDVLERYADDVPGAACATVAYAVVDSAAGTVDYACAGHPYPLVVSEDGQTRYLRAGRRPPLAIGGGASAASGRDSLPAGSLLLLYTDGLIERPGEILDAGFARLAEAAGALTGLDVDTVCARLLDTMVPPGGYRDDVALLAIRPTGTTPASFVAAHPADPAALPALRNRLRAWLLAGPVSDPARADGIADGLCAKVAEAVGSAARSDARQTVAIELFASTVALRATVGVHAPNHPNIELTFEL